MSKKSGKLTVAHLVSPYLFPTGTWIYSQLKFAHQYRPVVMTQCFDRPEQYPFKPIYHVHSNISIIKKLESFIRKYMGSFVPALYLPGIKKEGVQLIHAHMGWEGVRAMAVAKAAGLPLITTFYGRDAGINPRFPWWRWWYRRLFKAGTLFTVEGPHLGHLLEKFGCPSDKIRVIHLGIDLDQIPLHQKTLREDVTDEPVEIVVSSSLRPKKGVVSAIRAFAYIASSYPKAHLRILGDGPERLRVKQEILRHHLKGRVTLEGYVSYQRHLEVLSSADLFLAPSRTAPDGDTEGGAPVALIEAQAACLPIISTRHADIPEIVVDGTSGLLSPEGDDEALARNLRWMMDHPEMWILMGRAGRSRMEREFNIHIQTRQLTEIYRSV